MASSVVLIGGFLHAGFGGAWVVVDAGPQDLACLVIAGTGEFDDLAVFELAIHGDVTGAVVFPLLAAAVGAAGVDDAVVVVVAVGGGDTADGACQTVA
ncbi:MAG: hypothetical protein V4495_16090, partial [Pseudomonadota bacterium]